MAKQPVNSEEQVSPEVEEKPDRCCGIVMPIAAMLPDYDAAHWIRVKEVISEAITAADFVPRLVSESDDVGVIHGHIVQNLYDDEIVVCDVSGKNPNVMFELGMRLAFDKPTIIVQDDSNGYSFDIGPIKHIPYRRDQRFDDVQEFKNKVKVAITATLAKKQADDNFSPFLKHFGHFTPKKVEDHEIPQAEFILKKLASMEKHLSFLGTMATKASREGSYRQLELQRYFEQLSKSDRDQVERIRRAMANVSSKAHRDANANPSAKAALRDHVLEMVGTNMPTEMGHRLFDLAWELSNENAFD